MVTALALIGTALWGKATGGVAQIWPMENKFGGFSAARARAVGKAGEEGNEEAHPPSKGAQDNVETRCPQVSPQVSPGFYREKFRKPKGS